MVTNNKEFHAKNGLRVGTGSGTQVVDSSGNWAGLNIPLAKLTLGTLGVSTGGTGAATFTAGYVKSTGGTNALTTSASIPGSDISGNITGSAGGLTATLVATSGGTGLSSYTLGDIIYASNTTTLSKLTGNTAATRKFLSQVGDGVNSATPSWYTLAKSDIGLGSVENTALSTWAGSTNITTLGTIATGTWNATAIADGKIATALTGKTYNGLSLTSLTTGFTIAGGTTSKTLQVNNSLTFSGTDSVTVNFGGGGTTAYTSNKLNSFAATTSAELAGIISDETGSGSLVFATSPTLITPTLGDALATTINKLAISVSSTANATLNLTSGTSITLPGTSGTVSLDNQQFYLGGTQIAINRASAALPVINVFEVKSALGADNIDLSVGSYFTKTISGNTTLTVSNIPTTGTAASFILELTNAGAYTVIFGSGFTSIKWPNGTTPTFTSSGTDIIGFYTHDAGSTWRAVMVAKDSK